MFKKYYTNLANVTEIDGIYLYPPFPPNLFNKIFH